jgi:hypothetical protein
MAGRPRADSRKTLALHALRRRIARALSQSHFGGLSRITRISTIAHPNFQSDLA